MEKNKQGISRIIESINIVIEAAQYLYSTTCTQTFDSFINVVKDMIDLLVAIDKHISHLKEPNLDFNHIKKIFIPNAIYSAKQILKYERSRSDKLIMKIEFELIPILEDLYLEFYLSAYVKGDISREKEFLKNEAPKIGGNKYIDEYMKSGTYKYDVSIYILAYNKLDYTKKCAESVLKYTPSYINYELILVNNGSTDGTKEYFESIHPTKQIDLRENGIGRFIFRKIVQGKYILSISNDVIVTHNYLENMLECIESDEKIFKVVPTTPNISNLQTIDCNFNDLNTMHEFAYNNNTSAPYRWEQRTRLCDPISLCRSSKYCSSNGFIESIRPFIALQAFPDDASASIVRRNGEKMILAKDAFCYHFGSVTYKETNTNEKFIHARKEFEKYMGFDPWGKGFCYDYKLMELLPCDDKEHVEILGINCGIGSNPLKIKETIKEKAHNLDVCIYNLTDEKQYVGELTGVSDYVQYIEDVSNFNKVLNNKTFKYIIFEGNLSKFSDPIKLLLNLSKHLVKDGVLIVFDSTNKCEKIIKERIDGISNLCSDSINNDSTWYVIKNMREI